MRSLLLAAVCLSLGMVTAQTAPATPAVPAIPLSQSGTVASPGPLQVGQTWLLDGRTDQGRAFRAELVLSDLPAAERRDLEEGLRGRPGTARITGMFTGVQKTSSSFTFLLLVAGQRASEIVMVMPQSSFDFFANEQAPDLADELAFCTLLPGKDRRQLRGLALRSREEGESYSATVSGTAGAKGDEREQLLASLRVAYAPIFGVGDCALTRR